MEKGAKYGHDLHLEATELRLGLPGSDAVEKPVPSLAAKSNKRVFSDAAGAEDAAGPADREITAPATKAQVVGWPPVRSFRMNNLNVSKKKEADASGIYVKVSMDGAPYLRKIDLKTCRDYQDLLKALEKMFSCFTMMGEFGKRDASEYVPTYEDKDGDWMLVGDVPWEMFVSSCKRLRVMKGSEARGLTAAGSHALRVMKGSEARGLTAAGSHA